MTNTTRTVYTVEQSKFQQVIDLVESLSIDDQAVLIDLIQKRLHQQRRNQLVQEVKAAETEYSQGNVRRGTTANLMAELDD
jgi:tRNA A37 N6-isopentenylltransferase MiaA